LLGVEFLCLFEAAFGTLFAPGNASADCAQLVGVLDAFGGEDVVFLAWLIAAGTVSAPTFLLGHIRVRIK
jgi:hypothetical protein